MTIEKVVNLTSMKTKEVTPDAHMSITIHKDQNPGIFTHQVKLAGMKVYQVMISIIRLMRMHEARVAQRAEHAQEPSEDNKISFKTRPQ